MNLYEQKTKKSPKFDQSLADSYIGKTILIGVTYLDSKGTFIEQEQMHGVLKSASPQGISITLKGHRNGQSWDMPPSLDVISIAEPGTYTLKETSESIENPDLLATWTIYKSE